MTEYCNNFLEIKPLCFSKGFLKTNAKVIPVKSAIAGETTGIRQLAARMKKNIFLPFSIFPLKN
jgi:hypothetical protein